MSTQATTISNLSEGQANALAFFLHTLKKDSILERMHGNHSEEDFDPEMLSKMRRTIDNLMIGPDEPREFYQIAAMLINQKHGNADPMFNEICTIIALYQMGIEEGKRAERKKKATNCN